MRVWSIVSIWELKVVFEYSTNRRIIYDLIASLKILIQQSYLHMNQLPISCFTKYPVYR